jgi:hypothetical protein
MKQISTEWEAAQRQLIELREQVERATELAEAKVQANFLSRELDRALRDLGEGVYGLIDSGQLVVPQKVSAAVKAVRQAKQKTEAHASDIEALLAEGAEVASQARSREKKSNSATERVARKAKKR